MAQRTLIAAGLICALALAGPAWAGSYTWNGTPQDWDIVGGWTPTDGIPASSLDTGLIDTGSAKMNVDLGTADDWPTITVATGGEVTQTGGNHTLTMPLTLDGGVYRGETHWGDWRYFDGTLTLASDSTFAGYRGNYFDIRGQVTGAGKLIAEAYDDYLGTGVVVRLSQENNYAGGTWLTGTRPVSVQAYANKALGSGTLRVDYGTVSFGTTQDYAKAEPPMIVLNGGGVSTEAYTAPMEIKMPITVLSGGGSLRNGHWTEDNLLDHPVTLDGGDLSFYGYRADAPTGFRITGLISGSGGLATYQADVYDGTTAALELAGANNTYAGGTQVVSGGLRVTADQALGSGTVEVHSGSIGGSYDYYLHAGLSVEADQTYAKGAQPLVLVNAGGAFYVAVADGQSLNMDVTLNGGELSGWWGSGDRNNTLAGDVTLTADSKLGTARGELTVTGQVTGNYKLTKTQNYSQTAQRYMYGPIILNNAANSYSGGTDVEVGTLKSASGGSLGSGTVRVTKARSADAFGTYSGARLETVTNDGALDKPGQVINIEPDGALILNTIELGASRADVNVLPVGALADNASNTFVFAGAGKNINLHRGAILDENVAITRGEVDGLTDGSGFGVYKGYNRTATISDTINVGDSGDNVYRGIAAINGGNTVTFAGTMVDDACAGVSLAAQAGSTLDVASAAAFTCPAKAAPPELNLEGAGSHRIHASTDGSLPNVINYNGAFEVRLMDANTLSGRTLNVNGGYAYGETADAIDGTVNVNDGGNLYCSKQYTGATVTVNGGGGLFLARVADVTAGYTVNAGTQVGIMTSNNAGLTFAQPLPGAGLASYLMDADAWDYWNRTITVDHGVTLSDSTRLGLLCTPHAAGGNGARVAGGDLTSTGSTARLTALDGKTLQVDNRLTLSGKKLICGSSAPMKTMMRYARGYADVAQDGVVYLTNTSNEIAEIEVQSGTLQVYISASGGVGALGGATTPVHISQDTVLHVMSENAWYHPTFSGVLSGGGEVYFTDQYGTPRTDLTATIVPTASSDAGVSPGSSSGTLTIRGNLTLGSIELGVRDLNNATATFSQDSPYTVDKAVDGILSTEGWAINGASTPTVDQTAAFEVAAGEEPDSGQLTFKMEHLYNSSRHTLGRFRLAVTTADRSEFCDGAVSGGDVGDPSIWTVLGPDSLSSAGGATMTVHTDDSVLVVAPGAGITDTYTILCTTDLSGITGVRLEVMEDEDIPGLDLPDNGPGYGASNGNFVLSELKLLAGEASGIKYAQVIVDIESDGGTPGVDHDLLDVIGRANIANGELAVNLPLPSAELVPGSINAMVLQAGTLSGTFASVVRGATTDRHWDVGDDDVVYAKGTVSVVLDADDWTGFGGDADLNGVVNYLDLGLLATNYDQTGLGWSEGDFNFDGKVDYMDLGVLATNYDLTEGGGGANIPEPAAVFMLAFGAIGLLRRRR